jgi:hypothetical protein
VVLVFGHYFTSAFIRRYWSGYLRSSPQTAFLGKLRQL